jgi:hypothetical protein
MAENKTKATTASVSKYLALIEDPARRADCEALGKILSKATHQPAKMWGTGIVGFGSYHYQYESGREGEMCIIGFSSRKSDISLYGLGRFATSSGLLPKLGKYKMGKACLYIRRLEDIDLGILEKLAAGSFKSPPQS